MVEFWDEGDAIRAEEAMHCADVEGQNIAVQIYQPRRPAPEFNVAAPSFVPTGLAYSPYPTQVRPSK
jgi:polyadenylate-binding protein